MTRRPADDHLWGRTLKRWPEAEARSLELGLRLPPIEVWRSKLFLVQLFQDDGHVRVTVNRTVQPNGKDWAGGISWDDLQQIKREIGRGDAWAVEVFPPEAEVVNVATMRHLWLLDEPPAYGWKGQRAVEERAA